MPLAMSFQRKMVELIARYDRAVWIRVIGTVLTTVTNFMLRPFLLLYLYNQLDGKLLLSAMIIGMQPLAGILTNIWGGGLADRFGRKPLMILSLIIQAVTMFLYIFAKTPLEYGVLTFLNGCAGSLYFPAASAQIADVVPIEKRAEVFALLHTALNVGAAVGPLTGVMVFTRYPTLVFLLSTAALFIYAGLVVLFVPETLPQSVSDDEARLAKSEKKSRKINVRKLTGRELADILTVTALTIPISLLYAQVETTLPLQLKSVFGSAYTHIYGSLLSFNGTIVILLAILVARKTESWRLSRVLPLGYALFALVGWGYGLANSLVWLFLAEFCFTLGEMICLPHLQKAVSAMSAEEIRGRYFSLFGMHWGISRAFGPVAGSWLFLHVSGAALFLSISGLLIASGALQIWFIRRFEAPLPDHPTEPAGVSAAS